MNSYLQPRDQIDAGDLLSSLLISNTIRSQDFFLIPKEDYVEEQTKSWKVLFNPTMTESQTIDVATGTKTNGRKR